MGWPRGCGTSRHCSSSTGWWTPRNWTGRWRRSCPGRPRRTGHEWWRAPGWMRGSGHGCSPTPTSRCPNWACPWAAAFRSSGSRWWPTPRPRTTWSSARSARATRSPCSARHRPGTRARATGPGWSAIRAACCASSAARPARTSRSPCGTPPRSPGTWCCPGGPLARSATARPNWPRSSPATASLASPTSDATGRGPLAGPDLEREALGDRAADVQPGNIRLAHDQPHRSGMVIVRLHELDVLVGAGAVGTERVEQAVVATHLRRVVMRRLIAAAAVVADEHGLRFRPERCPGQRPRAVADQRDLLAFRGPAQAAAQRLPAHRLPGLPRVTELVRAVAAHRLQPAGIYRDVLDFGHAFSLRAGAPRCWRVSDVTVPPGWRTRSPAGRRARDPAGRRDQGPFRTSGARRAR